MRRIRQLTLVMLCTLAQLNLGAVLFAQNIFDDDSAETEVEKPEPKSTKSKSPEGDDANKPVKKKKKRKGKRKKSKQAVAAAAEASAPAEIADYTPETIARQSYVWAPEAQNVQLVSEAPGIKAETKPLQVKPTIAEDTTPQPESRPAGQGFKLPDIPLTQVLIVAGFVILFLIYRFRVGRQIKRKKY